MKRYLLFLIVFSIVLFNNCESVESAQKLSIKEDFKWVETNSDYKIKVPNYMEQTTVLNAEASLQQMDVLKEEYIIIIDEAKQEFIEAYKELGAYNHKLNTLENFHEVQTLHLKEAMKIELTSKHKPIKLKNSKAYFIEADAVIEGTDEKASYFIYHVESKSKLYTIMAWTLKKHQNIYREKVKKMMTTFNSYK